MGGQVEAIKKHAVATEKLADAITGHTEATNNLASAVKELSDKKFKD